MIRDAGAGLPIYNVLVVRSLLLAAAMLLLTYVPQLAVGARTPPDSSIYSSDSDDDNQCDFLNGFQFGNQQTRRNLEHPISYFHTVQNDSSEGASENDDSGNEDDTNSGGEGMDISSEDGEEMETDSEQDDDKTDGHNAGEERNIFLLEQTRRGFKRRKLGGDGSKEGTR